MIKALEGLIQTIFSENKELLGNVEQKEYLESNIRISVQELDNKLTIIGSNEITKRKINLTAKKYSKLFDCYRDIAVVEYNYLESKVEISFNEIEKKSKIIGYCRVSSKGQLENNSLEQQQKEIFNKYSGVILYKEQFTGATTNRPIFNMVISKVSKGDTLVVSKLDRLARNVKEGIEIIEGLFSRGVAVHVLNIGLLENTTMGKFFLTTMLAVAEMERSMIVERTQQGKAIARTKSGYIEGRPKKFTKLNIENALKLLSINGGSMSYKEASLATNISKSTLIREQKQIKIDKIS